MQQWKSGGGSEAMPGLPTSAASSSRDPAPARSACDDTKDTRIGHIELGQAFLEIAAGIIFIVGSICFLPEYTRNVNVFVLGCALFIIGACVYVGLSGLTLLDALKKDLSRPKICEHFLFFVGSLIFVYGTILFWPHKSASHVYVAGLKELSLVQYYDLMVPELEATILFMIGSAAFALAAVISALTTDPEDHEDKLVLTNAICNVIASLLFVIGSVPYLPPLKCNDYQVGIGAWCYIIGSVIFLGGGFATLGHVWLRHGYSLKFGGKGQDLEGEREPLVGNSPRRR